RASAGPAEPRRLAGDVRARQIGRHAHAGDRRQVLGARAIPALLPAPDRERRELDAGPHPERAGAGRPVEVVRRKGEQVDAAVVDLDRDAARSPDRVDVERNAAGALAVRITPAGAAPTSRATFARAPSSDERASSPSECWAPALPTPPSRNGRMTATTRGSTGEKPA